MLELVVDHNHVTGLVRGVICNGCNGVVGRIEKRNLGRQWLERLLKHVERER